MPQYRRNTANIGMKHQSINQNLKKVQEEHTIHVHVITIKILTLESFTLYLQSLFFKCVGSIPFSIHSSRI